MTLLATLLLRLPAALVFIVCVCDQCMQKNAVPGRTGSSTWVRRRA